MEKRILNFDNLAKALSYTPDIINFCKPLFEKTKINYFNFSRKYFDGSNIALTSNEAWTRTYYEKNFFDSVDSSKDIEQLKKREEEMGFRRFFRFEFDDCPAGKLGREEYGVEASLSMIMLSDHYYDCYFFGAEAGKYIDELMILYTQYPQIFSRFIFYFHEVCQPIIDNISYEKNRILIPNNQSIFNHEKNVNTLVEKNNDIEDIMSSLAPNKFRLITGKQEHFLTLREAQCVSLWLKGNTIKKIANELNLSCRTVETHLEKIKLKLNCTSKSEVVNLLVGKFDDNSGKNNIVSNMSLIESVIWR